jgi:hypothetical protein
VIYRKTTGEPQTADAGVAVEKMWVLTGNGFVTFIFS